MEKEKKIKTNKMGNQILLIVLFLITGAAAAGSAFCYGKTVFEIIRIVVMTLLGAGIVVFLWAEGSLNERLWQDNKEHLGRFLVFYLLSIAGAVLFPLLPTSGWPFLVIFIILALLSNQVTGMCAGSTVLLLTVLLEREGSYNEFFAYFIGGMAGLVLFSCINEAFRVGVSLLLSILVFLVCLSANQVLMKNQGITFEAGFVILSNLIICILLLLIFLKYYSVTVVHKYLDKYMEINDPEFPLLVALKEKSRTDYYHAIHTAYLSDKIAKKLALDDAAAKACGYYIKIGILREGEAAAQTLEIAQEYQFPPKVCRILYEYAHRDTSVTAKETVVVLFADTLISSISYLFSKDPTIKPDYGQIIEVIYQKKMDGGILDKSEITICELQRLKKILLEEKLYYDFLR